MKNHLIYWGEVNYIYLDNYLKTVINFDWNKWIWN